LQGAIRTPPSRAFARESDGYNLYQRHHSRSQLTRISSAAPSAARSALWVGRLEQVHDKTLPRKRQPSAAGPKGSSMVPVDVPVCSRDRRLQAHFSRLPAKDFLQPAAKESESG